MHEDISLKTILQYQESSCQLVAGQLYPLVLSSLVKSAVALLPIRTGALP